MGMYYSIFKTHIIPHFDKRIDEIEANDIAIWYKTFSNKSAIITAEAILKPAFELAILRKYINFTPFVLKKPKIQSTYKVLPFSLNEIDVLLSNCKSWFKNFVGLSLFTGMRTGEALALKWSDIDFVNFTIDINKTQSSGFLQTPKTKSSLRLIDMIPQAEEFLREQRKETGLREFVFIQNGKNLKSGSCLSNKWKNALVDSNLEHRGIYQTRHSFASNFLSNGEDLNWISQTLGHKNPAITQQKYFKYIPIKRKGRRNTFLDSIDTKSTQHSQEAPRVGTFL